MDYRLPMELRDVRSAERIVAGVCVPYDETSYLVPDPMGERVLRGAFARTIAHHAQASADRRVPLLRGHDLTTRMGTASRFVEQPDGLLGEFTVNEGAQGDQLLEECRLGYLAAMSVGFRPIQVDRAADGVREVREAALVEVSLVGVAAYAGATGLAVRAAQPVLAAFPPRPDVNLDPIAPLAYRSR